MTRKILCRTLGMNKCEIISITSPSTNDTLKELIILSARVHPGETVSSFVMKGIIDFLTSS